MAFAQTATLETLRAANSELTAGKSSAVIKRLDKAINAGQMSQANMARALYMRGRAKQAVGRTAEAIADLNSAIWFRKLPAREQKEAIAQRQKAYQSSGIKSPVPSTIAPKTASLPSKQQAAVLPVNRTAKPIQHKVARPLLSSTRLPEGQKRQEILKRTVTAPQSLAKPVPKWSQVVTGTIPPVKQSTQTVPNTRSVKPTTTAAAIPSFRQVTVPSRPAKTATASLAKPIKTWSPVTQQFTAPPRAPAPVSQPKPPAVAAVIKTTPPARTATAAASQSRPEPHAPKLLSPKPKPEAKAPSGQPSGQPLGVANIGSLLFGGSASEKPDAVAAADRLQAERRARIQAHNKNIAAQ